MESPCSSITSSKCTASRSSSTDLSTIFKVPVGRAKQKKSKILDEETYIEKIGEIIQRDFFPDLEKLKAQNEYIEALEHNDTKKMRELYEKYSLDCRPRTERMASPATFETPVHGGNVNDTPTSTTSSKNEKDENKSKLRVKERKIGLDEFLSSNTSEDNASFEEILEDNEKKHRLKHAWLYKKETGSNILSIENGQGTQLSIENDPKKKPFKIDTWSYKNKNYIMYIPDGVELTPDEQIELAKKRQEVLHSNTRLKVNPFNEQQNKETMNELAKVQSKTKDGKIGIDGKEIVRNETPRINGYTILGTPSPMAESVMDTPMMTWGMIEGTPFRLDGGDTPLIHVSQGPSFRMAEPPKREKIALQLAEKAGERNRDKKMIALNAARRSLATPSPRSNIDRLNTMSPAARRLATQKLRLTVSPSPNRCSSKTPLIGIRTPNSPRYNLPLGKTTGTRINLVSQPVLTDNLLKLPQRQRAADFFNS